MAELGKRQADLVHDRGWPKGRVSKFFHGRYSYRKEVVNELAEWLQIEPFELLMDPREALAIRSLRTAAAVIAGTDVDRAKHERSPPGATIDGPRTGTEG